MTMPPFDLWLAGTEDITGFMTTIGAACAGSRLIPTVANGAPAFAHYKPREDGEPGFVPWAVQVLDLSGGRITGLHCFLDTPKWFPLFGLAPALDAEGRPVGGDEAPDLPSPVERARKIIEAERAAGA